MGNTHRKTRRIPTRIGIPHRCQRNRHRRRRIKIRRRRNRRPLEPHTRNLNRTLEKDVIHALFAQRIRIRENKIGFANRNGQRVRRNTRCERTRTSIQRIGHGAGVERNLELCSCFCWLDEDPETVDRRYRVYVARCIRGGKVVDALHIRCANGRDIDHSETSERHCTRGDSHDESLENR